MASQTETVVNTDVALKTRNNWSLPTRLLHIGMVATVTAQLALSLMMESPDEENISVLASAAFEAHELIGMAALVIVLSHWLWTLFNHADGGFRHLFPWFGEARAEVVREAQAMLGGKLPESGVRGGLPGFIHGLGLLIISGMVVTGGTLFFIMPESGEFTGVVEWLAESHETIATLIWLYWGGHGATAILHHLKGDSILKDMFSFSRRQ